MIENILKESMNFSGKSNFQIDTISKKDIAIVGISIKLPMADDIYTFWDSIKNGIDCITDFPEARKNDIDNYLLSTGVEEDEIKYFKGAYLKEIDKFDYKFFKFSPKEASLIDPSQRLFLEVAFKAIEDAGYGGNKLVGSKTGVYVGFGNDLRNGYLGLIAHGEYSSVRIAIPGNISAIIPSRISYMLDLRGPAMVVDTACSSSLVAVHLACQGIHNDDCEMAIAGGVKLNIVPQDKSEERIGIESSDFKTKSFDDNSDGTGKGEGVAAILLKPLYKAIKDNDNIYAVIKGSAINQDGSSMGITAPNPTAQAEVIDAAWNNAGIDPETITYIEAHGTGTKIGDPIEIDGISRAFRRYTNKKQFCLIGTIKTNIGHLFEGAGIVGLVKAALALKNREIPPIIHFKNPNNKIEFESSPVYISGRLEKWDPECMIRRCGVNAFGFSGTNCHVILQEPPAAEDDTVSAKGEPYIFALSAKSQESLLMLVEEYKKYLSKNENLNIRDLCYTALTGRGHYNCRIAMVVNSIQDLKSKIEGISNSYLDGNSNRNFFYGELNKIGLKGEPLNNAEINNDQNEFAGKRDNEDCLKGIKLASNIEDLEEICKQYVDKRHDIDWEGLFPQKGKRISLPTYAFERRRCWVNLPDSEKRLENLFYTVGWKHKDLDKEIRNVSNNYILMMCNESDKADSLLSKLRSEGINVIEVSYKGKFQQFDKFTYSVGNDITDYKRLIEKIGDVKLSAIIHMFTYDNCYFPSNMDELNETQNKGVYSLLHFIKSYLNSKEDPLDVILVSRLTKIVSGAEDRICPENVTLFGLGRVLGREYSQIKCRCIDMDDSTGIDVILEELKREANAYQVAYREGKRYVEEFSCINVPEKNEGKIPIKSEGVYLITGGLGGIGTETGKYLASRNKLNLAYINRTKLPSREKWDEILAKADDVKLCDKIKSIKEIESKGSTVTCYSADVSDFNQVKTIIDDLRVKHGKINGIIHGAGVPGDKLIVDKAHSEFERVMHPKVQGTWILHKVTENDNLDFFVVFSSIATIFSASGQGDYAAANAYLDSFSSYRNRLGKKTLSINWVAWKEVGMAVDCRVNVDTLFKAITTRKAIDAFDRVVSANIERVLIGELNFDSGMINMFEKYPIRISQEIKHEIERKKGRHKNNQKLKGQASRGSVEINGRENDEYSDIERSIAQIWADILGYSEINIHDNFYELGGDSLIAIKIVNQINEQLNVSINMSDALSYLTITEFASHVQDVLGSKNADASVDNSSVKTEPEEAKRLYPLSSVQNRLFILDKYENVGTSYNLPMAIITDGKLDMDKVRRAFKELVARHEVLRTSFHFENGESMQRVHENIDFEVEVLTTDKDDIDEIVKEFVRPYNLETAPLLRAGVVELYKQRHLIIFDMHHIISDGVSINILMKEFAAIYNGGTLPPVKAQYRQFSLWQEEHLKSEEIKKQEEYWIKELGDEIPLLDMPTDFSRPAIYDSRGSSLMVSVPQNLASGLSSFAVENNVTVFTVMLGIFSTVLSKYSSQEDILIGTVTSGRNRFEFEETVGVFLNNLIFRCRPDKNKTFNEYIKNLNENMLNAYKNQDYPIEELIRRINPEYDRSRNILFDVMIIKRVVDKQMDEIKIPDLKMTHHNVGENTSKYDITLYIYDGNELNLEIEYSTKLFKKETIQRFGQHMLNVMSQIVEEPEARLGEICVLSEAERKQTLLDFNNTFESISSGKTIIELFEKQVKLAPDNLAVTFDDKSITYKELNERSNQLARMIKSKGVKPDDIVGIMVERSIEMIIGVLAILKSGGAYLPIDPDYPDERIKYLLEDSGTEILITQNYLREKIDYKCELIDINDKNICLLDNTDLFGVNPPSGLAYVIYTSGTTGDPKGVMVEHRNLLNASLGWRKEYKLDSFDVMLLQMASFSFDVFTGDIARALLNGGHLIICPSDIKADPASLYNLITKYKINIFESTPSLIMPLFDYIYENKLDSGELEILIIGSDICPAESFNWLLQNYGHKMRIINSYGVTEATIDSSYYEHKPDDELPTGNIPIGKPLPNVKYYVLDSGLNPQPVGVAGELYIGGAGVARGYLNRNELTKEKFMENPFIISEKIYRTGDYAKWLPDGNLEFLGRKDNQVKIRGYRIELGEIESQLLKHESIKEAIVIDYHDKYGYKNLCAYIVSEKEVSALELKDFLSNRVPEYMVPSYFIGIDKVPLSSNGKVDRNKLPDIGDAIKSSVEYCLPQTEVQEKLAKMWCEILSAERIGIKDDFFDLGGHSLKAMTLLSRIHKEFNVTMPLTELFKGSTLNEVARFIENSEKKAYSQIRPVEEKDLYELSPAQKRVFILEWFENSGTSYNIPEIVEIVGALDTTRLEQAFKDIISRHEALRTSFDLVDSLPVQYVHKDVDFNIEQTEADESQMDLIVKEFIQPFDLTKHPLLRAKIVKIGEERHFLLFDIHHIISDGVSIGIIVKEMTELYAKKDLPGLRVQYKDFAEWQNKYLNGDKVKNQEQYWTNLYAGETPVLNMPTDYPRPSNQSFDGESVYSRISKEFTGQMNKFASKTGTTLYMVLLGAYSIMLSKYSGQEDIIIGTPVAGRLHADTENIIGMFVNTLAVRSFPKHCMTVSEFLRSVKDTTLSAFENQSYQFEELVNKLNLNRDLSRNPLFDTMFIMQNTDIPEIVVDNLKFLPYQFDKRASKFDITLEVSEAGEELDLKFEFCTKLFKKATIERMANHYINILKEIIEDADKKLSEICMIGQSERKQLLVDFNDSKANYPKELSINHLFERQASKTPDSIAVKFGREYLTYRELNEESNKVAWYLNSIGFGKNSVVGVMMERSLQLIIGIMGVLKAGAAYLPIDTNYPEARIQYIIQNSQSRIIITKDAYMGKTNGSGIKLVNIDEVLKDNSLSTENLNLEYDSERLMYVLYTSGSTGVPKGSAIKSHAFVNLVDWFTKEFNICNSDNILLIASTSFDLAQKNLFSSIIKGGKLFLFETGQYDYEYMSDLLEEETITIINCTPSAFYPLIDFNTDTSFRRLKSLKKVFLGGEPINPTKILPWIESGECNAEIVNTYGPTECTDIASFYRIDSNKLKHMNTIPIGTPIQNAKLYILDSHMNVLPVGVPGELLIGGTGVAKGYYNNDKLTKEKFIEVSHISDGILYKTGDCVKWLSDGNIEFLGRIDNQVKIRGFRIELEEIENQLIKHKMVKNVVVTAREDAIGNKYLCSYVVSVEKIQPNELREFLLNCIPDFMVPSQFIFMDKLPLTPNGKIDRKALPLCDFMLPEVEYVSPENKKQEILAEIWGQILGTEKVGIDDDFFDLGGDSIKAIQTIAKLQKYQMKLNITDLFQHPTIREVSEYLENTVRIADQGIVEGEVGLTPIQRWFFENDFTDMHHWNQSVMVFSKKGFNEDAVRATFQKITVHHDALRTVFRIDNEDVIIQQVLGIDGELFTFEVFDITDKQDIEKVIGDESTRLQGSISLENGPLVKLGLFKTGKGDYLLIVIHHLVMDGISWRVIFEDFAVAYQKALSNDEINLQYKTDSYKKWSKALYDYADSNDMLKEINYWKSLEDIEVPDLPKDKVTDDKRSGNRRIERIKLTKEETAKLIKNANQAYNTEVNDILLTALGLAVKEWTGMDKVLLTLEGHGREFLNSNIDISRTVGWFTSLYPVILNLASDDYSYTIKSIKETLRHIPNKGMAYGILRYLTSQANKSQFVSRLKPEIIFNYLGQFDADVNTEMFNISSVNCGPTTSPESEMIYCLEIVGIVADNTLQVDFIYNSKMYKADTIKYLAAEYKNRLIEIVEHCVNKDATEATPSDFYYNDLSIDELDDISVEIDDVLDGDIV